MRHLVIILCGLLSAVLLSCHDGSRHEATLRWADSLNRNYIEIPSDSQLLEAVDYYDRFGTSNERMRAHYLLGCAYRDMGEAPKALECYHDAADCADTLSSECDYGMLYRIHSQIGGLFYNQEDCHDCLKSYSLASRYAWKANDTIQAIVNDFLRANAYDKLNMPDSSLAIRLKAHNSFENIHQEKLAAQVLGGTFATLLEQGKLQLAAHYMKKYEENSGYFNSNGDIEKGREVYYYYKGLYFLCVDSLEKAYSLFKQIEKDTSEVNNRKAYYKGMFEYYKKSHNVPMSARFAELYAIASDSSYQALSTEKMYAMQASYIYNRNERIATQKAQEAIRHRNMLYLSLLIAACLTLSLIAIYIRWRSQHRELALVRRKYSSDIVNLSRSTKELKQLVGMRDSRITELIIQKEEEIKNYQQQISEAINGKNFRLSKIDSKLLQSDVVKRIKHCARNVARQIPTDDDWIELRNLLKNETPNFFVFLDEDFYNISDIDIRICMLIRIGFQPKDIANLVDCSLQKVANTRKRLQKRILGDDKGTHYFDEVLKSIS